MGAGNVRPTAHIWSDRRRAGKLVEAISVVRGMYGVARAFIICTHAHAEMQEVCRNIDFD
jgi:hypothetical protein